MRYSIYKKLILKDKRSINLDFKPDGREHYVYRVTDYTRTELENYYGSHTPSKDKEYNNLIEEFWSYKTSSKYNILSERKNYKVKILKVFDNPADKMIYEAFLHQYFDVKLHNSFWNESNQTPFGFDATGKSYTAHKIEENGLSVAVNRSRKGIKTMGVEGLKARAKKGVENRDSRALSDKAMKTKRDNNFDFNENARKGANTRGKKGYDKSSRQMKETKRNKGKWYILKSVFQEEDICIIPAVEVRKISGSLPNKTKDNYLGKTRTAQGLLKRNNKMELYGLYVEESDRMQEMGLEPKPINGMISKVARMYFQDRLDKEAGL